MLTLSYLIFSIEEYIFHKNLFIILAILARSIQGIAVGGVCTLAYSYIGILFADRYYFFFNIKFNNYTY